MKKEAALWFVVCAFLAVWIFAGCGTVPTPTPTPGPTPEPVDYSLVCQHLADLGCAEGRAPECATAFGTFQGARLSDLQPSCIMSKTTKAGVRECGSVLCE